MHHNLHEGKIGVLCLAPEEGLGIDDPEFREKVGEDKITLFRRHGAGAGASERTCHGPTAVGCSPRSTTSPSRSTTSTPPSPSTTRSSAPSSTTARCVESDGVEEALLKVAESYIQLLTPTRDDSPVAKYLEKRGEGLHHVGYRVDGLRRGARGGEGARAPG